MSEMPLTVNAFAIEVEPREVDAGADIMLSGQIAFSPPQDVREQTILIRDSEGRILAEADLTEFDGAVNKAGPLVLKAPVQPGEYIWSAVLTAGAVGDTPREEATTTFAFTVHPHETSIVVWDVPPTIVAGERFAIKVGVKCSSACRPTGWLAEIRDHDGCVAATATLSDEPWRGTGALRYAEVQLQAPCEQGLYRWKAAAPGADLTIPHTVQSMEFGVRTVPPPEFRVRIEVLDKESQAPISGAKVVVHPYRTFTDGEGVAEIRVPKGDYTILVSGKKHIPFRTSGLVTEDMTVRAELALDVGLSEAEIWS